MNIGHTRYRKILTDAKEKIRKSFLFPTDFPSPSTGEGMGGGVKANTLHLNPPPQGGRRFHIFAKISFKKFISKILDDQE